MELKDKIIDILIEHNNLRKDDPTVKSVCIRVINMIISYGLYGVDEKGNIYGLKNRRMDKLSNFELLHLIETIISSNDKKLLDNFLVKSIQSIDYIGKAWFYPKELSRLIFEKTSHRHNFKKIKAILNRLVDENICLKLTDKKNQSTYRILYTY